MHNGRKCITATCPAACFISEADRFKMKFGNVGGVCNKSINFDDENKVSDDSDMQHGTWTKLGAEQPCLPLSSKPGLNMDLKYPCKPVE
jgi:hypothetical protein